MNAELFVAYVAKHLATALRSADIVIMDNLPVHTASGVRTAIEAAGATLLYLPPYSPDLNPIEMVFAKLKSQLRATAIRTVDALWKAVGAIGGALSSNVDRMVGDVRQIRPRVELRDETT